MSDSAVWRVKPGSMGVVAVICKCLSTEACRPGSWGTPAYFTGTRDDADCIRELLNEQGAAAEPPIVFAVTVYE